MAEEGFNRKLVAILSADAVGYSRLMQDNEDDTVRDITANRLLLTEIINQNDGRVIDSPGDNLLAEFTSVVGAVNGAIKFQEEIKLRNADVPQNRKMNFRIGIHLGDVIYESDRIYGDGVNIAARLEGLAATGGISISSTVYEQIKNKLALDYQYLGEQNVKNIPDPIKVYRILLTPEPTGNVIVEKDVRSHRRYWVFTICAVLVIGFVAAGSWIFNHSSYIYEKNAGTSKESVSLAEKPSIAVLPLNNLSGDSEQEYFSDGITNDIITELSKFRELSVIASNSVFIYKGKPVKAQKVNQELGARYILEGSIQRSGQNVRINAQLIDATTGHHLWAERYDRNIDDLFAVQDEIVRTIVATLAVKIDAEERARVLRKETKNLKAYDYLLRGREYSSLSTRSANIKARQMFERAIELDPFYTSAFVGLGRAHMDRISYGWTEYPDQTLQLAHDIAQKALTLDASYASTHSLLGIVYRYRMQYDLAIDEYERAVELNPNDARTKAFLGMVMNYNSQPDKAIQRLETALHLDPKMSPASYMHLGIAYYLEGRYEDSVNTLKRGLNWYPNHVFIHIPLAATYAQLGRIEESKHSAATVLRLHPFFEVASFGNAFINPTDRDSISDGLRKAGLR